MTPISPFAASAIEDSNYNKKRDRNKTMIIVKPPSELTRFRILYSRCVLQVLRNWVSQAREVKYKVLKLNPNFLFADVHVSKAWRSYSDRFDIRRNIFRIWK